MDTVQDIQGIGVGNDEDIGILLIGNTGSGKSATGNSILGYQEFQSRGGYVAVTKEHHVGVMRLEDGRVVKVVDTPGLNDTELSTKKERLNLVIHEITQALIQFPNGFTAVLPVVPYTQRMIEEERKTVETMASLLGSAALETHGILGLSYGDAFNRDFPGSNANIVKWMDHLPSKYTWLHELCDERCVIFNNVTENQVEKNCQRATLVNLVDNLGTAERFIPEICNVQADTMSTVIRDREQVMRYIKAQNVLGILKFKIEMAILDETYFTQDFERKLRVESNTIVQMLRNDRIFGGSTLENLSKQINSLNHADQSVQNKANDVLEAIHSLQLKIDTKIESTIYWKSLRRRVYDFFNNLFDNCEIV